MGVLTHTCIDRDGPGRAEMTRNPAAGGTTLAAGPPAAGRGPGAAPEAGLGRGDSAATRKERGRADQGEPECYGTGSGSHC